MKLLLIGLLIFVASCASTSKMEEVEEKILAGQTTITELDKKIIQLEQDKQALQQQLEFIDDSSESEAIGIREKIASIDASIGSYKSEIIKINTYLGEHSTQISNVQAQQSTQRKAVSEAIKKNEELKQQAAREIQALEREYDERRRKKDSDEKN
jgi:chromosome segregation ATPase